MRRLFSRYKERSEPAETVPSVTLPLDYLLGLAALAHRAGRARNSGLTAFPGLAQTRRRGSGLEFEDLRAYAAGDDLRHVDWKVTARRGSLFSRLYRDERERATTVALDLRPSMFTGLRRLRAVRAGEIAAGLLWRASRSGDRVGIAVHTAGGITATRPMTGTRGVLPALRALADGFAAGAGARGRADPPLSELIAWANRSGRGSGDVILVSGLDADSEVLGPLLAEGGARGKLKLVMVEDDGEVEALPVGRYAFATGSGTRILNLGATAARQMADRLRTDLAALREGASAAEVPVLTAAPEAGLPQLLAQAVHDGFVSGG